MAQPNGPVTELWSRHCHAQTAQAGHATYLSRAIPLPDKIDREYDEIFQAS